MKQTLLLIILVIQSSCYKPVMLKEQPVHKDCKSFLGSIVKFQDTNEKVYHVFIAQGTHIRYFDSIYKLAVSSDEKYMKVLRFYSLDTVYPVNIIERSLFETNIYVLKDSVAPKQVRDNILKDLSIIYDDDIPMSSNMIWYCKNGYFPASCCYESPPTVYVNMRSCLGMRNYNFKR